MTDAAGVAAAAARLGLDESLEQLGGGDLSLISSPREPEALMFLQGSLLRLNGAVGRGEGGTSRGGGFMTRSQR